MSNLELYLTTAHSRRHKVTLLSTAVATGIGAATVFLGGSSLASFLTCVATAGIVELVGALTYTPKTSKNKRKRTGDALRFQPALLKRRLLQLALSIIVIIVMVRVPSITAAALLARASSEPTLPESSRAAIQVLTRAKAAEVKIGSSTLKKAGQNFLSAAKEQPAAGDAALALANYRSSLNSSPVPLTQLKPDDNWVPWNHTMPEPIPGQPANFEVLRGPNVPAASAAVMELGQKLNVGRPLGPSFINFLFHGTSGGIGGARMKHIIFTDGVIYYGGNPIEMEDIYFVNCRFVVALDNANGRNFVSAILRGNPVSYSASENSSSDR